MMTRNDYNSVSKSIDALQDPLALPIRYTPMLQDLMLLAGDSIRSTQDSLAEESALLARTVTSPLMIPEVTTGIIANTVS